jgi:hypothetical protein
MGTSAVYIAVSVVVLGIVAVMAFFVRREGKENRLTPWAGLAFAFVVAGILFGEDRLIGYGLMGAGVVLAVVDIVNRSKGRP